MRIVAVVHHPDDSPYADEVVGELVEQGITVRRHPALPREELRRADLPRPTFDPESTVLLFVLTTRFPDTAWFDFLEEVAPASGQPLQVSLLFEDSAIPGILQDKAFIDFREKDHRLQANRLLLNVVRTVHTGTSGPDTVEVPHAKARGQVSLFFVRPEHWYCIFCGWDCQQEHNSYRCGQCKKIRPFAGGSATMIECAVCHRYSLGVAAFCEWCGHAH